MLSIIVPVYNTSKYLPRCLDSLINQTYKNIEIIVINDGSTDNSLEILESYASKDKRIKLINSENKGVSNARNLGLEKAKGELIGFVDSDDKIELDMYEMLISNMIKYNTAISACDIYKVKNSVKARNDDRKVKLYSKNESLLDFLTTNSLLRITVNKIYKRELLSDIRFNTNLANSEDRLFLYEIYKKEPEIVKENIPKYYYYFNPNSASNMAFKESHKGIITSANIIYEDVLKNNDSLLKEVSNYKFESLIIFIRKLELATNKKDYINYYNQIRREIINISSRINLSFKRKMEVFILKNLNFLYHLFVKIVN